MRIVSIILLLLWPLGALAQGPLDAAAFDARTQGRTITYSQFGEVYGIEEYLPDRRVRWAFVGGECKVGSWFQDGEHICFLYDDGTDLQCWVFTETETGLMARFRGMPDSEPLVSLVESRAPLVCAEAWHGV